MYLPNLNLHITVSFFILIVSFKIYDCDKDGFINSKDLSTIVGATLREQDVVINEIDLDQIVEQTMKEANSGQHGLISYDE